MWFVINFCSCRLAALNRWAIYWPFCKFQFGKCSNLNKWEYTTTSFKCAFCSHIAALVEFRLHKLARPCKNTPKPGNVFMLPCHCHNSWYYLMEAHVYYLLLSKASKLILYMILWFQGDLCSLSVSVSLINYFSTTTFCQTVTTLEPEDCLLNSSPPTSSPLLNSDEKVTLMYHYPCKSC